MQELIDKKAEEKFKTLINNNDNLFNNEIEEYI